jgi:thiamine biosynthesis lipoprotein
MNYRGLKSLLYLLFIIALWSCKQNDQKEFVKLNGYAFGTTFNISFYDTEQRDLTNQIDSLFYLVNRSLSTYLSNSDISKINRGDSNILVDDYFKEVFKKSEKIYAETNGVFDPTIGILVNAWGFGPVRNNVSNDSTSIKELLKLVGFNKVQLNNGKVEKYHDSIYLDFNAIAKGYAVDIAGRFLEQQQIKDYLVEIGGEIRTRGRNSGKNAPWKIGIENPNFDGSRSIQKVIELKDESMATSGNYRKFTIDSITGKKYVHIINTKTGYPSKSNLLSVSVIGKLDCADVDGYATALMAMTLEEATLFLENHNELKSFIIYSDRENNLQTFTTSNF